ncbi:hypothetical protein [Methylopila sp. M107]|uniref:hypothetical protein n=1 Tax=Methylopila sp. M107 TaxID=1101190 RepID=UPI00037E3446|nr:hypothetical protein [Methylopila sp. M107]
MSHTHHDHAHHDHAGHGHAGHAHDAPKRPARRVEPRDPAFSLLRASAAARLAIAFAAIAAVWAGVLWTMA